MKKSNKDRLKRNACILKYVYDIIFFRGEYYEKKR